jgi:hypothetical protein
MLAQRIHRNSTRVLSLLMIALGVALAVQAITGDGGVFSSRMLLGVLMIAAGGGRIYLERRRSREA